MQFPKLTWETGEAKKSSGMPKLSWENEKPAEKKKDEKEQPSHIPVILSAIPGQQVTAEIQPTVKAPQSDPESYKGWFATPNLEELSPVRREAYERSKNTPLKPLLNLITNATQAYENSKAGKFNTRVSDAALGTLTGKEQESISTGNKIADTAADMVGFAGGLAMGGPNSLQNSMSGVGRLATKGLTKLLPKAGPIAQNAVKGGAEFGALTAGQGVTRGDSIEDIAKDTALNTAFGAVLGAAPEVAGNVIKKGRDTITSKLKPKFKQIDTPAAKSLTSYDTPEIIEARAKLNEIPATDVINTPARQSLRTEIAEKLYGQGAVNKNKRADIVIGPPAAGKSSAIVKPVAQENGSLVIDSDMAKEMLPEFQKGIGAGAVHKESDHIILEQVLPRAVENGDNIVLPLVGKNTKKIKELKDELIQQGYSVHLHLNELSPDKAAQRAVTRYMETGRFVDPKYVMEIGWSPSKTYDILKSEGGFGSYAKWSNDVPKGQSPKLIEKAGAVGRGVEEAQSLSRLGGGSRPGSLEKVAGETGTTKINGELTAGEKPALIMPPELPTPESYEKLLKSEKSKGTIPLASDSITMTAGKDLPVLKPPAITPPNLPANMRPEPVIPEGELERGFNKNVRTDSYMNDQIRDEFTTNPLSYEQLGNKGTLARAQARFDKGYESALEEWHRSLGTFRAEDVPLARLIANEAAVRGDMETARKVVADVAEKLTQAGQFSQAARILRQAEDPGAFTIYVQQQIKKINDQGAKRFGKKWEDIQITDDEMNLINSMKPGDEAGREKIMEQIYNRIIERIPVTNLEKFDSWRRMAMLLNPKTHVRNIGGNVIMMGLRKTADTVGAGLEKTFRLQEGQRSKTVGWSRDKNLVETVNREWDINKKDLLQEGRYDIESFSMLNREKPIFKNRKLEGANEFSKWALNVGDAPFLKRAYTDALGQYMKVNNLREVTEAAGEYAKRRAYEATFKQINFLSDTLSRLKRTPGIGRGVEALIPFSKTPTNIVMRAVEYSPLGLMKALYSKTAGKQPADVIEDLAKGLTGSGIAALGYFLADMGWARAEKSSSKNAEALIQQKGEQQNSIITPLGSYTFDWAQPFAVPLAMGMVLFENLDKKDTIDVKAMADSLAAGTDTVFNMSVLQNIKEFMGGYGGISEQIAGLPLSYVEQALPTVMGQITRTLDDTKRSTYDPNPVKQTLKGIAVRVPGLSKTLEPKLDVFGNEQKQGGALQQFLSPGYWKDKAEDPVTQEIIRVYKMTKNGNMLPKVAPFKFTYNRKEITLLPAEVTQFQRTMGQKNYEDIQRFLNDNPQASDERKAKALAAIVDENYENTKKMFIKK